MTKEMVIHELESLQWKRFSLDSLHTHLFKAFNLERHIDLEDATQYDDDEATDFNLIGNLNAHGLFCDFDIYYLKMRNKGWDGSTILITGVEYEFQ